MKKSDDVPRCLCCGGVPPYHFPTCVWKGYIEEPLTEREIGVLRRRAGIRKNAP